ncbi:MAG: hypothetical protein GKR89_07760 [Candidatus Latescibacteria bacterium]|nr:hypothetical protein [Candidatus Latescibacterota bacterium]
MRRAAPTTISLLYYACHTALYLACLASVISSTALRALFTQPNPHHLAPTQFALYAALTDRAQAAEPLLDGLANFAVEMHLIFMQLSGSCGC